MLGLPVATLREKGGLTRLMVLRALHRQGAPTLRKVADEVGVTVQAVSEHIKRLQEDQHVRATDAGPRLTESGLEHLRESLTGLKAYVDEAVRELARIESTAARAGGPIRSGEPVGLFMEGGDLVAYPGRESPSRGRAEQDAAPGEDLVVTDLEGIVGLEPGAITIGVVPDAEAGGSRRVDLARAEELAQDAELVIAMGPVARHVLERVGAEPVRYGAPAVAADASLRGVDSVIVCEAQALPGLLDQLDANLQERGLTVEPKVSHL